MICGRARRQRPRVLGKRWQLGCGIGVSGLRYRFRCGAEGVCADCAGRFTVITARALGKIRVITASASGGVLTAGNVLIAEGSQRG